MTVSNQTTVDPAPKQTTLTEIYNQYARQMLAVANRILHNAQDAEDAVQNALIGIGRSLKNIPAEAAAQRNYVLIAARNAALRIQKKNEARARMEEMSSPYETAPESDPIFTKVAHSMDAERVCRLVLQMPPIYQDVLYLTYVEKLEPSEIAQLLQRKPNTVRQQLSRGRKILMSLWMDEEMKK